MTENFWKGKTCLVTGGAGSIGSHLVCKLLGEIRNSKRVENGPKSIRVLDLSEYNLFKLRELVRRDERVRLLLGDIRDANRVEMAVKGTDIVIHMAAVKHVDIAYYNPWEAVNTNVIGTKNVIEACLREPSVKKVVFTSSDKAVNPIGLYGVTKLIGEKSFEWAADIQNEKDFCIMRFGNVIESSGNVFEIWKMQNNKGLSVTLTGRDMKRYFWTMKECVNFIIKSMNIIKNRDLLIPKMKEYNLYDLAIKKGYSIRFVPPRPDEKLAEDLMTCRPKLSEDGMFMTIPESKRAEDKGFCWLVRPKETIKSG